MGFRQKQNTGPEAAFLHGDFTFKKSLKKSAKRAYPKMTLEPI
jgi:hypothetical protein